MYLPRNITLIFLNLFSGSRPLPNPFAMDILHGKMFWIDKKTGSVQEMDKFGRGMNISIVNSLQYVVPNDVVTFQEMKYDLLSK